jgi:hypothetical protein
MSADILVVTCARDEQWFRHTLPLMLGNFQGFRRLVAVAPEQDEHLFKDIRGVDWKFIPDWPGRGYFWQQWVKINGPAYCPGAERIIHLDSDIFVKRRVHLDDFGNSWLMAQYCSIPAVPWKASTERDCGFDVQYEYMRGFPFIINTKTHFKTQEHLESRFNMPFAEHIRAREVFSEFNLMGAIAHRFHPELYNWVDLSDNQAEPAPFSKVFHAWIKPPANEAETYVNSILNQ